MLDAFNEYHGAQDVIFLTGDLSSHHTAMNFDQTDNTYSLLLDTHQQVVNHLDTYLPNTIILPAFGNNDNEYHDNPEPLEDD